MSTFKEVVAVLGMLIIIGVIDHERSAFGQVPEAERADFVINACYDDNARPVEDSQAPKGYKCVCNPGFTKRPKPGAPGESICSKGERHPETSGEPGRRPSAPPGGPSGPNPKPNPKEECKNEASRRAKECAANLESSQKACVERQEGRSRNYCRLKIKYNSDDITAADRIKYAEVCTTVRIHLGREIGKIRKPLEECKRDVAKQKAIDEIDSCFQDLMKGSGRWWDTLKAGVNYKGVGGEVAIDTQKLKSPHDYCKEQTDTLDKICGQMLFCDNEKCDGRTPPNCVP